MLGDLTRDIDAGPFCRQHVLSGLLLVCTLVLTLGAMAQYARAQGVGECFACHSNSDFATYSPEGKVISLFVDPKRYAASVHGKNLCTDCHANFAAGLHREAGGPAEPRGGMIPVEVPPKELAIVAKLRTQDKVAVLQCIKCHENEGRQYRESIHGSQALAGNRDAPDCVTCHGSHYTARNEDIESSVNRPHVPRTCAQCHQNSRVMAKYDIATDTVVSFQESFHGKKLKLGSQKVAVCTSCHGVHDIFPPNDPRSTVYPANRAETCGKCHKKADRWFARDFSHKIPSRRIQPVAFWVGVVYKWLIYLTIGAMACFVFLDLGRTLLNVRARGNTD